jgi:hypothetical protein
VIATQARPSGRVPGWQHTPAELTWPRGQQPVLSKTEPGPHGVVGVTGIVGVTGNTGTGVTPLIGTQAWRLASGVKPREQH